MGTVFEAWDEKLDRLVAVKVVKPEQLQNPTVRRRFVQEAHAIAAIRHPNVVDLFDSGELGDGSMFLVMERLHGRDLADLHRLSGCGTPAQVAALLRQGAAALGAAHRAGIVHRDIKPENVFLCREGVGFRVRLLDFGLAKRVDGDRKLTQSGLIVGTPAWMAPEQVSGREVDERTDVYSFAAVCYLALVGPRGDRRVRPRPGLRRRREEPAPPRLDAPPRRPAARRRGLPGRPRQEPGRPPPRRRGLGRGARRRPSTGFPARGAGWAIPAGRAPAGIRPSTLITARPPVEPLLASRGALFAAPRTPRIRDGTTPCPAGLLGWSAPCTSRSERRATSSSPT